MLRTVRRQNASCSALMGWSAKAAACRPASVTTTSGPESSINPRSRKSSRNPRAVVRKLWLLLLLVLCSRKYLSIGIGVWPVPATPARTKSSPKTPSSFACSPRSTKRAIHCIAFESLGNSATWLGKPFIVCSALRFGVPILLDNPSFENAGGRAGGNGDRRDVFRYLIPKLPLARRVGHVTGCGAPPLLR